MKCSVCSTCERLIRVDLENGSHLSWYCPFCESATDAYTKNKLDPDSLVLKLTKEKFNILYKDYGIRSRKNANNI